MDDDGSDLCMQCSSAFSLLLRYSNPCFSPPLSPYDVHHLPLNHSPTHPPTPHVPSLLLRRHHCRRCGGLYCSVCCSHYVLIPAEVPIASPPYSIFRDRDPSTPSRCCSSCATLLGERAPAEASRLSSAVIGASSTQLNSGRSNTEGSGSDMSNTDTSNNDMPPSFRAPDRDCRSVQPPSMSVSAVTSVSVSLTPSLHGSSPSASSSVTQPALQTHLRDPPGDTPLREVACQEWRAGTVGAGKHKLYAVTVPSSIPRGRIFQVSLDNRCPPLSSHRSL